MVETPPEFASRPLASAPARIVALGIGGAGCNALRLLAHTPIRRLELMAYDPDAQPEAGQEAPLRDLDLVLERLAGADMLVVLAGLGGSTGSSAAPVVVRAARERGVLTLAVLTTPLPEEGVERCLLAGAALRELAQVVNGYTVVPMEKALSAPGGAVSSAQAYRVADEWMQGAVRDLMDCVEGTLAWPEEMIRGGNSGPGIE